jgi:8-oxo-dGTP diphosphatase
MLIAYMLGVEVGSMAKQVPGRVETGEAALPDDDPSAYPHPSLTVDVALITAAEGSLRVLLLRRDRPPDAGRWALPGGFVRIDESLDKAAERVLRQKIGLKGLFLEQLYTFGEPKRDPRTRVVTVGYYALVPAQRLAGAGIPGGEATRLATLHVRWAGEAGGPAEALDEAGTPLPLAFDHGEILGMVVKRLRGKLDYAPIGFELLPEQFSLRALQQIHETISGRRLNKDSFRRRMLATGQLEATGEHRTDVDYRPPELYRLKTGRPA